MWPAACHIGGEIGSLLVCRQTSLPLMDVASLFGFVRETNWRDHVEAFNEKMTGGDSWAFVRRFWPAERICAPCGLLCAVFTKTATPDGEVITIRLREDQCSIMATPGEFQRTAIADVIQPALASGMIDRPDHSLYGMLPGVQTQ